MTAGPPGCCRVRTGVGMVHCDPERAACGLCRLNRVDRSEPDDFHRRFGERLRRAREEQRLTLAAVEVLSHGRFKPGTIRSYELGMRAISVETAAELASMYGVKLGELLEP